MPCKNIVEVAANKDLGSIQLHPSRIFKQFQVPENDIESADFKSLSIGYNSDTWIISCDSTNHEGDTDIEDGINNVIKVDEDITIREDGNGELSKEQDGFKSLTTDQKPEETDRKTQPQPISTPVTHKRDKYVLQRINHEVFHQPENIDHNNRLLLAHIDKHHPNIVFPRLFSTKREGATVLHDEDTGNYYRLYEFMAHSYTQCVVDSLERAYESARTFAAFGRAFSTPNDMMNDLINQLKVTYPDYHNLLLRHQQFLTALDAGSMERQAIAREEVEELQRHEDILHTFKEIAGIDEEIEDQLLAELSATDRQVIHDPAITVTAFLQEKKQDQDHQQRRKNKLVARVTHHDCKISNMLFNRRNHKGLCVIDLDTTMPGYFLSDLGALYRTSLSPGGEESTDFSQVYVRLDYFEATSRGYLDEMRSVLTEFELQHIVYAGEFMIYMQCISYLTDFLRGDVYYKVKHSLHNHVRAQNQIKLLKSYRALRSQMQMIVDHILNEYD